MVPVWVSGSGEVQALFTQFNLLAVVMSVSPTQLVRFEDYESLKSSVTAKDISLLRTRPLTHQETVDNIKATLKNTKELLARVTGQMRKELDLA
jgi:hypothetical protein